MKAVDFPVIQELAKAAKLQLEFYNVMMASKLKQEENKMAPKKLFIVDTISTFRHRYVIEAAELSHAYDEVTMIDSGNEADSFEPVSQKYLGETIIDGREITKEAYDSMLVEFATDSEESTSHWMGDKLIRTIDYGDN